VEALIASHLPALQVAVLLLGVPFVAIMRARHLAWAAATAISLLGFAIAVQLTRTVFAGGPLDYDVGGWPAPYGIALHVDAFSVLMLLVVTGASSLTLLAAHRTLGDEVGAVREPLFYAAWLLVAAGLCGILVSGDAFNVFVFLEISSLATYVLVAAGRDRRALLAAFNYLVMGTMGGSCYLIGVGLIYMMTGTLNLADMVVRVGDVADTRPVMLAAAFITIGLALKAAVFPLHLWLPDAYTRAPHLVTAFIAACSTKVVLYILFRFDFMVFQSNAPGHGLQFAGLLMPLALVAMLVASVIAIYQQDVKRMLAWSSIGQLGYVLLGASMLSAAGLAAGIIHLFNHALIKATLFFAIACLGTRLARLELRDLSGIARQMPWTMAAFVAAGISLIGVPGTAGFISKWHLVSAALETGTPGILLVAAILTSSLLAVVYIGRVVEQGYFSAPVDAGARAHREAPIWMLLVTWLGVGGNVYFGVQPGVPLALARSAATTLLGLAP
jgi:multicomponent Na+:H+ antiporter subunit D